MKKYTLEQLQNKILYFINYRIRSQQEVLTKLKHLGATPDQIQLLIDQLVSHGLLDDQKFIHFFIHENLYGKKRSISDTKRMLRQKGFKEHLINDAFLEFLDANDFSELEQAVHALKQKYNFNTTLESKKMLAFLGRRGFLYSVASEAVKLYLESHHNLK